MVGQVPALPLFRLGSDPAVVLLRRPRLRPRRPRPRDHLLGRTHCRDLRLRRAPPLRLVEHRRPPFRQLDLHFLLLHQTIDSWALGTLSPASPVRVDEIGRVWGAPYPVMSRRRPAARLPQRKEWALRVRPEAGFSVFFLVQSRGEWGRRFAR